MASPTTAVIAEPRALNGRAATPADGTAQLPGGLEAPWRRWARVGLPLVLILLACVPFRVLLARGEAQLLSPLDGELLAQPWRLLLPFDLGGGRYRWTPTGYVVVGLMNLVLPAPLIFVVLLAVLVAVAYLASLAAFRSRVFSGTLAMAMAFGTQFNFTYVHNGGSHWILYTLYLLVNLVYLYVLASEPTPRRRTRVGFAISLVVFALCWEQWLDYLVFLLAGCAGAWMLCRRDPALWARYAGRMRFVGITTVVVTAAYLAVKLPYSAEHLTAGHESDTIFTYSHPIMGVEDFVSSVFTYPYIALTNFTPSCFSSSNTLYHYGAEAILQEQNGYHEAKTQLVVMHHLFFWYYYAGAVFVAFAWFAARSFRAAWKAPGHHSVMLAALVLLICTGFATHSIIKYRPYLSVPLLAYKCQISVIGVTLLLAYGTTRAAAWFPNRRLYLGAVAALWLFIVGVGIDGFPYQSHLSREVGLGEFPNPLRAAKQLIRGTH